MEDRAEAFCELAPPVGEQLESLGATILIVEDEGLLRRVALDLIRANRDSVDVVLLDVALPGIPSPEVFEETQRIRPALKIYSRARTERKLSMCRSLGCQSSIFRKPFQVDDLVAFLRRAGILTRANPIFFLSLA